MNILTLRVSARGAGVYGPPPGISGTSQVQSFTLSVRQLPAILNIMG